MNEQPVIHTRGLTRYFGNKPAVYDLNLKVLRGSVFAFLGRNGSGKTTTIRMLLGLLQPTRGEGSILGSMIGVFIMSFLRNGCTMMGWPNYIQEIIIGAIIVAAVSLDQIRHRRAA